MLNVQEEQIDKITEAFYLILNGKKALPVSLPERRVIMNMKLFSGELQSAETADSESMINEDSTWKAKGRMMK